MHESHVSQEVKPERSARQHPDHPSPHPKGLPRPDESPRLQAELSVIELSPPVNPSAIDPSTPYVLDAFGRVLCADGAVGDTQHWAYVAPYQSYPQAVYPVYVTGDPTQGSGAALQIQPLLSMQPLYSTGQSTNWNWAKWIDPNTANSPNDQRMILKAQPGQQDPSGVHYRLYWMNNSTRMYLAADGGAWNWLYVSASASPEEFLFRKFYVNKAKLENLFRATWPNADFRYLEFGTGDDHFEAIDHFQAQQIYRDSGLSAYRYRPEVFDCDDYSYVYKGQASKQAYAANAQLGYAVGVIFARSANGAHAVNLYINTAGIVQILEPQNGQIVAGKDWKDDKGSPYAPYFILM